MEDILIIGSGPIGLYASILASLHGLKGIVFEGLDIVGGQLSSLYPDKEIVDLPGFNTIKAQDFIDNLIKQNKSRENALEIKLNESVISYRRENDYFIVITNKNAYQTKTILLTTGMGVFSPRKLELENINQYQNIIYSIKDTSLLKDKEIIILGGGDSAIDWANTLSSICSKVSIVHRRNDFRGKEESVNQMIKNGVNIYKPYQVKAVNGIENKAKSIIIEQENNLVELPFDYLFVNYGLITEKNSFEIENKNGYLVNTFMMTSEENIFAIGNACNYQGKVKNITAGLGEAVIAITKIDQIIHPNKNIPIHF